MKILFIAPEIPWPLNKGTCQRTFAILKTLSSQHQITFSAPVGEEYQSKLDGISHLIEHFIPVPQEAIERATIPRKGSRIGRLLNFLQSVIKGCAPFNFQLTNHIWHEELQDEFDRHDLFFCRYAYLHEVYKGLPYSKVIMDFDDLQCMVLWRKAISWNSGWESILIGVESIRTYLYECYLTRHKAIISLVCSEKDRRRLLGNRAHVVRNGVDLCSRALPDVEPLPNTLAFIGAFTYEPNRAGLKWFCQEVWPLIREKNTMAKLRVAGFGMEEANMDFAKLDGIELLGQVSDPAVTIREAQLMVVPLLYGTGTRVKIAESMGYGRTVVSTSIGAEGYEDFSAADGLFRADKPQDIAKIIVDLLADNSDCLALGEKAQKVALERLDWRKTTLPLLELIGKSAVK